MQRTAAALLLLCLSACGGGSSSPTSPDPTPTPTTQTRIIALEGDLNFGDVSVDASAEKVIRVLNRGNAALTVSGLNGPTDISASWTNGTINPNAWQDITIRFNPKTAQSYNGTLTVSGNQTSGGNTMPVTARGVRPNFFKSGSGNTVFDLPTGITRMRIIGIFNGSSTNFIVRVGGHLVVNELLGTFWGPTRYDAIHLTSGTVVEITNSSAVQWSFEEIR